MIYLKIVLWNIISRRYIHYPELIISKHACVGYKNININNEIEFKIIFFFLLWKIFSRLLLNIAVKIYTHVQVLITQLLAHLQQLPAITITVTKSTTTTGTITNHKSTLPNAFTIENKSVSVSIGVNVVYIMSVCLSVCLSFSRYRFMSVCMSVCVLLFS